MAFTDTISRQFNDGLATYSFQGVVSAGLADNVDLAVAQGAVNQSLAFAFTKAKLQLFWVQCDQCVTLKTNSASAPQETFVLTPGVPLTWTTLDAYFAAPFVSDVTGLFVSCGNAAAVLPPVQSATGTAVSGGTLTNGTYFYVVTALTANGESVASNERTQVTTGSNISTVTVNWTQVTGATGYKIYRGTVTNTENALVTTVGSGATVTFIDTGAATTAAVPPTLSTATVPAVVQSTAVIAAGGNLAVGTTYYWVVTATTAAGEASVSNQQSLTPTVGNQAATIAWTQVVGATGYKVYRSTTPGVYGPFSLAATIGSGATVTTLDTGAATTSGQPPTSPAPVQTTAVIASGGTLATAATFWVVTAVLPAGESTASNEKTLTPSGGNLSATLNWNAVAGATGYKVYRSTSSGVYGATSLVTTITNGSTVTYLDTGTTLLAGTPATSFPANLRIRTLSNP